MNQLTNPLTNRGKDEQGSALALIPVLAMIVIFASALVIDSSIGFTAKRALVDVASAAANDAANGLQSDTLFESGAVRLDARLVDQIARQSVAAHGDGLQDIQLVSAQITSRDGRPAVRVVVTGTATKVFGLDGEKQWNLTATAVSVTREDD